MISEMKTNNGTTITATFPPTDKSYHHSKIPIKKNIVFMMKDTITIQLDFFAIKFVFRYVFSMVVTLLSVATAFRPPSLLLVYVQIVSIDRLHSHSTPSPDRIYSKQSTSKLASSFENRWVGKSGFYCITYHREVQPPRDDTHMKGTGLAVG